MSKKILKLIIVIAIIIVLGLIVYTTIKHFKDEKLMGKHYEIISTYNNPIVPEGFKAVDTENAKWLKENEIVRDWNKGLVIEDSIGNQFVWIPVNTEDLEYNTYYVKEDVQYKKEKLNINQEEDKQILKYGGFYISRYEAGVAEEMQNTLNGIGSKTNDIQGIPVSKKGIIPWNYISLKNAKINAETMYQLDTVKSGLPTLKQWQFIMKWLNDSSYNVYEDSSNFGNYSNVNFKFTGYYSEDKGENYVYAEDKIKGGYTMILSTGATERNMVNNIYDLAGNLWCYTSDYFPNNESEILGYYCAGGHFDNAGNWFSAYNYNLKNVVPLDKVGFRMVLFLP